MSQGAYYLMWHPDHPDESQMLQAMNLNMALRLCSFPNDGRREYYKSTERPSVLTQTAVMEGDINLVERAIMYWRLSDKSKKPRGRALECFKEAFGRSYKKHEAMALSDIVEGALELEQVPPGEEEIIDAGKDEVIQSGDTPEDPGGEGDDGVRLGRPSWSDEKRVEQKVEREPTMEALGDPRDIDAAEKRARRGG